MVRFLPIGAVLAALGGCVAPISGPPLSGQWGGQHVGLNLDESGGRLEYDCAAGTISEPVIPARDGSFAAEGTHTPGTGGPARIDQVPASYPAHYTGEVDGSTMTLTVEVPARELVIGPLDLRRGAAPDLTRCL